MAGSADAGHGLPDGMWRVLAVVAHPDDESFGLGGLLALLSGSGVPTPVLCFTHGESSTLHGRPGSVPRSARSACRRSRRARSRASSAVSAAHAPGSPPWSRPTSRATRLMGRSAGASRRHRTAILRPQPVTRRLSSFVGGRSRPAVAIVLTLLGRVGGSPQRVSTAI
ncbi:PIG-L family deacetylase [Streptomyces sp. MNU76]|uniref:PIG-L family deacetylase n=1 Tax=Streptomyces sp. MNU76 TaxID=2560026 RepID=UPI001E639A8F|nr:PIG-L family deacetylase [Streptomyces sp. MNU76]MCC9710940.1 PIG-L family deacetylase [Streptomyces sp. MNU76]